MSTGLSASRSGPTPPSITIATSASTSSSSPGSSKLKGRARSGSLIQVEEIKESLDDVLDQNAYTNFNAQWVHSKGAWVIHPVLIVLGKLLFDSMPGVNQELSWTFTTVSYMFFSFLMFHHVTGTPFGSDQHAGAYDNLTMWEQIDEGDQNTPAKKWLVCVPIALFLLSTHFTNYNPWLFAVNFASLVPVLVAKLPMMDRHRIRILPAEDASGFATPTTPHHSGSSTPRPLSFVAPK